MQNERLPEDRPRSTEPEPKPPGVSQRQPREIGGPPGPEPTRFGDWEKGGRCIDF